eukprot:4153584-Alexandrium_andersonii.AAC.1
MLLLMLRPWLLRRLGLLLWRLLELLPGRLLPPAALDSFPDRRLAAQTRNWALPARPHLIK